MVRDGVLEICRASAYGITLCVVDGNFRDLEAFTASRMEFERTRESQAHQATAPDEKTSYRREEDADDEERREDSSWCKNRLPGLQSLLLECSVCTRKYDHSVYG